MLSIVVFLPLAAAVTLLAVPAVSDALAGRLWVAVTAVEVVLAGVLWWRYTAPGTGALAFGGDGARALFEEQVAWIPGVNSSYHIGVDGLSLPLVAMTSVVFLACAVYSLRDTDRPRTQAALFLFLQTVSLGLFVAADLILFTVDAREHMTGNDDKISTWLRRSRKPVILVANKSFQDDPSALSRIYIRANPGAVYREPLDMAGYLDNPIVSDPLRKLDCCLVNDGGVARADQRSDERDRRRPGAAGWWSRRAGP